VIFRAYNAMHCDRCQVSLPAASQVYLITTLTGVMHVYCERCSLAFAEEQSQISIDYTSGLQSGTGLESADGVTALDVEAVRVSGQAEDQA